MPDNNRFKPVPKLKEGHNQGIVSEILETPPAPPPEPVKPPAKKGRPKGPDKVKKTFYMAADLALIKMARANLIRNAGIFLDDDSDLIDLALYAIAAIAENTELTEFINTVYKNSQNK